MSDAQEEMARRVLITGATGLLGRQVCRIFAEKHWLIRGLGMQRAKDPVVRCDLLADGQLEAQFESFSPSIVIHCAAERRPDKLEGNEDYARRLNAEVTKRLGRLCENHKAWMVYLSTNYVFDGKNAPYSEAAATNPLSVYGRSKLDGEVSVVEVHPRAAILRIPLLFGPLEHLGESSVTALLDSITNAAPRFDNWQERFPTYSADVAGVLEAFAAAYITRARAAPEEFAGIFHWQANQMQTKYTMAKTIADIAGLPADHFISVDTPSASSARRPRFERMSCARCEKVLGIQGMPGKFRTDFKVALEHCLHPFLGKVRHSNSIAHAVSTLPAETSKRPSSDATVAPCPKRPRSDEGTFVLAVVLQFDSEEKVKKLEEIFAPLAKYVRIHEPTTLSYSLLKSDKDPKQVMVFERYEDKENAYLAIHRSSAEFLEFKDKLMALKPVINGHSYHEKNSDHSGFVSRCTE